VQNNTKWNYKSTTFIKICVDVFIIHGDLNQSNSKKESLYHPWQDGSFQNYSSKTCDKKQNGFKFWSTPNHFD
jgi:hypothetical protein